MLSISHNSLWILNSQHNSATIVVHWTHNVLSVYEYWTEKSTNAEHTRQFSVWSLEASHHRDESWLHNSLLVLVVLWSCEDLWIVSFQDRSKLNSKVDLPYWNLPNFRTSPLFAHPPPKFPNLPHNVLNTPFSFPRPRTTTEHCCRQPLRPWQQPQLFLCSVRQTGGAHRWNQMASNQQWWEKRASYGQNSD